MTHPTGPSTDRSIHPTAVKPARNQQFLSLQGKQIKQQLQNTIQSSEQTRIDLHLQQFVVSDSGVLYSQARTLTFRSDTNASIHNLSTLATVLDRSGLVLNKLIDHDINQFNRNQSVINNQLNNINDMTDTNDTATEAINTFNHRTFQQFQFDTTSNRLRIE